MNLDILVLEKVCIVLVQHENIANISTTYVMQKKLGMGKNNVLHTDVI